MARLARELTPILSASQMLHPRENLVAAGVLSTVNSEFPLVTDGCATVSVDLRGVFSMTLEVSGTVDGTNWTLIPMRPINLASLSYVAAIVGTVQGVWVGSCSQYRAVRVRCTAYTSGAASITLAASNAPMNDNMNGMVTPLLATQSGASGAGLTLTVPSPGAGLRQYITYISLVRSSTALLVASATPNVITTTNLPGPLAFTMGQDALLQGGDKVIREDFAYPLAASAQGVAVTIVCPAVTGALWRATAGYNVAP